MTKRPYKYRDRRAWTKEWKAKNPERIRGYFAAWRQKNPEKVAAASVECRRRYGSMPRDASTPAKPTWTAAETDLVLKREVSDEELSKLLDRTVTAIKVRRAKCSKLAKMGGHT